MDLSYEARWGNLRAELEACDAALAMLEADTRNPFASKAAMKRDGLRIALTFMDDADRVNGPRA